jgi:hypothetical protein
MPVPKVTVALTVLLTAVLGQLDAQQPQDRTIWAAGGFGAGWSRVHCEICEGGREFGPAGYLGVGALFGKHLAIGAEVGGWRKKEESITQQSLTFSAAVYWYPAPESRRYFLKGGLGAVSYKADDIAGEEEENEEPFKSNAVGAQIGIGYKFYITRAVTLSPYLTFTGSFKADLKRGNTTVTSVSLTLIQFGLAVGWN